MKYTKFIPEFYFSPKKEEWIEVNKLQENWTETDFILHFKSIIQMLPHLIVVIFNEKDSDGENVIGLYQGILE